jgi:hypothetical protein
MSSSKASPYRQPVTWIRDQVEQDTVKFHHQHQSYERQGRKKSRSRGTRGISEEEYDRLKLRGPKHLEEILNHEVELERWPENLKLDQCVSPWERQNPVRVLETGTGTDGSALPHVHRWPESEKHIKGGSPYKPKATENRNAVKNALLLNTETNLEVKRWPENKHINGHVNWGRPHTPSKLQGITRFSDAFYQKAYLEEKYESLKQTQPDQHRNQLQAVPPQNDWENRKNIDFLEFPRIGVDEVPRNDFVEDFQLTHDEIVAITKIRKRLIEMLASAPEYFDDDEYSGMGNDGYTEYKDDFVHAHEEDTSLQQRKQISSKAPLFSPDSSPYHEVINVHSVSKKPCRPHSANLSSSRNTNPQSQRRQLAPVPANTTKVKVSNTSGDKTPASRPKSQGGNTGSSSAAFPESRMSPRQLKQYKQEVQEKKINAGHVENKKIPQHPLATPPRISETKFSDMTKGLAQNLLDRFQSTVSSKEVNRGKEDKTRKEDEKKAKPQSEAKLLPHPSKSVDSVVVTDKPEIEMSVLNKSSLQPTCNHHSLSTVPSSCGSEENYYSSSHAGSSSKLLANNSSSSFLSVNSLEKKTRDAVFHTAKKFWNDLLRKELPKIQESIVKFKQSMLSQNNCLVCCNNMVSSVSNSIFLFHINLRSENCILLS